MRSTEKMSSTSSKLDWNVAEIVLKMDSNLRNRRPEKDLFQKD